MNRIALREAARRLWLDPAVGIDVLEAAAKQLNRHFRKRVEYHAGDEAEEARDGVLAVGHGLMNDCLSRAPVTAAGQSYGEAVLLACGLRHRDLALHIHQQYQGLGLQCTPHVHVTLLEEYLFKGSTHAALAAPPPNLALPIHAPPPGCAVAVVCSLQRDLEALLETTLAPRLASGLVCFYHRHGAHGEVVATWQRALVPSGHVLDMRVVGAIRASQDFLRTRASAGAARVRAARS
eukprot:TRINITY_DN3000_c0_g1_i2.p1 TRINITY_DN3000_c0_g1~~TRINITY_DN3000_c0_g1_i2.p1  ORF type:complete len:236 (+),score=26.78 TRINITY_DN3000_c0_g1_i2:156-863(+)